MAIAYTSNLGSANQDGESQTIQSSAFACTTGNAIVVCAWALEGVTPGISGIVDTASNSYAELRTGDMNVTSGRNGHIWLAQNITGHASNQVTVTFNQANASFRHVWAFELSGVATSSAHDTGFAPAINQDSSSPATTTPDDTATDGEWLIGIFDDLGGGGTFDTSDSSVIRHGSYPGICIATKEIPTAGSATIGVTFTATTVGCLAAAIKAGVTGQFARPAADRADGTWTNEASSNVNLYASIDEETANDADYIRSAAAPTNDTCTVDLSAISTPVAGTVTMRIRARFL